MSLEVAALKTTQDVANKGVKLIETSIKQAWSFLDAAAEKQAPSKILSTQAINSIQGNFHP